MKYEAPELRTLTSAINAIQETNGSTKLSNQNDAITPGDYDDGTVGCYQDWE